MTKQQTGGRAAFQGGLALKVIRADGTVETPGVSWVKRLKQSWRNLWRRG